MKIDELVSLARKDPLSWGICYVDLLEDKAWEIETRRWMVEPYQQLNPWVIEREPDGHPRRMSIIKSTQAGISTTALVKALHFADNWSVRIGYSLPRQQDTLDFVTTRVDPVLQSSPRLQAKLGQPDSVHAKRLGNSYLFFIEMSTEPRMMPMDALFVDEVDLSNPDNMATALNRLDASRWKLNFFLSTPTVANFGIHNLFYASDMRRWLVRCPACNTDQALDWEKNLRFTGPANTPTSVFYGCVKCNRELTMDIIQTGRWVAERPDMSSQHVGYHISQMMTTPAVELYRIFRDPQTKLVEFYRKRLGMPYEIGGGSIERDDILAACFDEPYHYEPAWDGESTYYLGADQGNEIQVIISKLPPNSRRPKVVHIELIPMDKGFDRLAQLMDIYRVRKAVVDANPNRHSAVQLVNRFPGRVLIADYVEQKETWKALKGGERSYKSNVHINRTSGFDALFENIKKGMWALPGLPPNLDPDTELLIDHVTALKRDVENRRTAAGDTQVAVYRKLRAEHLAHAWLYMQVAKEVDGGRGARIAVIGDEEAQQDDSVITANQPSNEVVVDVTSLLAEVPKEQLADYLVNQFNPGYVMPFPLSHKLPLANAYGEDNVLFVINLLLNDKKRPYRLDISK